MIARLPLVQRRILAVFLLLLLLAVVVRALIVPAWSAYAGNRDAIAQIEDSIARFSRMSAQVDALLSVVTALEESDELARYVFVQESEPLAAAALRERVKLAVTNSGGTLTSTQVLPTEVEQGFKRIIVNVRIGVSTDALQRVLYALENDLPYLLADNIVILSRGNRKRRRKADAVDLLDVRLNLYGYMRDSGEPA